MAALDETPEGPIRVVYADDSFLMREALERVLERLDGVEVVAGCVDGDALLAAVEAQRPDVVLTDMRMPPSGDEEGIRVANRLRERHPGIGVVVLTQYAEPRYGLDLLAAGAEGRGYLLKERIHDPRELHAAIEAVAHGGSVFDPAIVRLLVAGVSVGARALDDLTARERQVLGEMAQGKSNAAIADSLVLTKKAIEKHIGAIFLKLGLPEEQVASRLVAAVLLYLAAEGEWVPPRR
jgi:DNA-binding NarL/FixJ family response regulator